MVLPTSFVPDSCIDPVGFHLAPYFCRSEAARRVTYGGAFYVHCTHTGDNRVGIPALLVLPARDFRTPAHAEGKARIVL